MVFQTKAVLTDTEPVLTASTAIIIMLSRFVSYKMKTTPD